MKKAISVILSIAMLASVFALQAMAEDRVFIVDFVTASWTVDGVAVTATVEGKDLQAGPVELRDFDAIRLNGFDGGRMVARVFAEDGFSAVLEPNGDNEVSLGRPVDPNVNLPGVLRFEVVKWEGPGEGPHDDPGEEPHEGPGGEPQDRVFTVDFVTASWTVDGVAVTATVEGKDLQAGPVELRDFDAIRLNGFDGGRMVARVFAEDGFSAVLEPNGDNEVSLGRPVDRNTHLPDTLRFVVEAGSQGGPGEEPGGPGEEPGDRKFSVDFGAAAWTVNGVELTVVMWGRDRMDGIVEIEEHDLVRVNNLDPATMQVRVYAEDGFSALLVPNENNEVSLYNRADPDLHLPDALRFVVEAKPKEEPGEDFLPGDVDGNGKIESADARLALRISVGLEPEMGKGTRAYHAADVTELEKGVVTSADARLILRRSVGYADPEYGV